MKHFARGWTSIGRGLLQGCVSQRMDWSGVLHYATSPTKSLQARGWHCYCLLPPNWRSQKMKHYIQRLKIPLKSILCFPCFVREQQDNNTFYSNADKIPRNASLKDAPAWLTDQLSGGRYKEILAHLKIDNMSGRHCLLDIYERNINVAILPEQKNEHTNKCNKYRMFEPRPLMSLFTYIGTFTAIQIIKTDKIA